MDGYHGGGTMEFKITDEEFEAVKSNKLSFDELVEITFDDPNRPMTKKR